jgi:hypothetical protein
LKRVAVLGAGIMGCSVALELARRGCHVVLVDAADAPFSGASRWNEGKLHLGYLYAGDPSLSTARHVLPGGVSFVDIASELLGCDLAPAITTEDDLYLVHRDSVVDAATTARRFKIVSDLVRSHPGAERYPGDASRGRLHALSRAERERVAGNDTIVAGFRVPERSISTTWVADRYVDALHAEPRIERAMGTRVLGVQPTDTCGNGRWRLRTDTPIDGDFDAVVNALWAGRLAIDADVGLQPEPGWSHRYRVSLFVRTRCAVDAPSLVVATGPFGDIKNYNGRDFYLSWYPAGLLVESRDMLPTAPAPVGACARSAIIDAIRAGLGASIPQTHAILDNAESVQVQGGWVFAQGHGSLADPASTVHRRDRFGIVRRGTYWSVDTGKYSTAPWLARQVAAAFAVVADG